MYALAFDMDTNELKNHQMYPQDYDEIKKILDDLGFNWIHKAASTPPASRH